MQKTAPTIAMKNWHIEKMKEANPYQSSVQTIMDELGLVEDFFEYILNRRSELKITLRERQDKLDEFLEEMDKDFSRTFDADINEVDFHARPSDFTSFQELRDLTRGSDTKDRATEATAVRLLNTPHMHDGRPGAKSRLATGIEYYDEPPFEQGE